MGTTIHIPMQRRQASGNTFDDQRVLVSASGVTELEALCVHL